MNYICTWLCIDAPGEESNYPQTGISSSSEKHQIIYWKCLITFFLTSKRFNKNEKHILFTNSRQFPIIDNVDVCNLLNQLDVDIILTDFKYKTPDGYHGRWRNQFYEFSIFEYISKNFNQNSDMFLLLDSDCIFLKPANDMFNQAIVDDGFMSYDMYYNVNKELNGLSRVGMKEVYESLLDKKIEIIPKYFGGEFFLSSQENIVKIFFDFEELWPKLLVRHEQKLKKFNEEAHVLSYIYYKNNFTEGHANKYIRRIWTNPVFYRDVLPKDLNLAIWHLPSEKTLGLEVLYKKTVFHFFNPSEIWSQTSYLNFICILFGIPDLSFKNRLKYYLHTYINAVKKRFIK